MREVCPDAWLLNYTNPMAMNIWYLRRVAPDAQGRRPVPLGLLDGHGLCELDRRPARGGRPTGSAGVNHQAWLLQWERDGEDLYPLLDERIAADPELRRRVRVDMYRRLGYYPTETSEHSSEYVPWYLRPRRARSSGCGIPVGEYIGISEENVAEYDAAARLARRRRAARHRRGRHRVRPAGHPQHRHRHAARDPRRTSPTTGLITNLPDGVGRRGAGRRSTRSGVHPVVVGDLPPQCAALNRALPRPGRARPCAPPSTATRGWSGRPRCSTRTPRPR